MDIFIARQPILDKRNRTIAYEILYRSEDKNFYTASDGNLATARVVFNTLQVFGLERLTGGRPAVINFTQDLLSDEIATLFPKDQLIVEVLESVVASDSVMEHCRALKRRGYRISLDDFVLSSFNERLLAVADLVKIDFLSMPIPELNKMIKRIRSLKTGITFVAEKVETHEVWQQAVEMGCTYFQGYYFQRPEMIREKSLRPLKADLVRIMILLLQDTIDFEQLARIISHDLFLAYHLLKLINSVVFGMRERIRSIQQALVIMGEEEVRKWLRLIILNDLTRDKPDEMVRTSLIRARMAEQLALKTYRSKEKADALFIAGLFSLIDSILDRPIEQALSELYMPESVRSVLLDEDNPQHEMLELVIAYEKAQWDEALRLINKMELPVDVVRDEHLAAIEWDHNMLP